MEKCRTRKFSLYLMITFLLISTFVMMMITEAYIIDVPLRKCPEGSRMSTTGKCMKIKRKG
nr:U17_MYRTX_Ta1k [Tetramorium africanum]